MTTENRPKDYSRQARIEENSKGEPHVIVTAQGDDSTEVHDDVMHLYTRLKTSLNEPRLDITPEEADIILYVFGDCPVSGYVDE
jgi:hypothetical protein